MGEIKHVKVEVKSKDGKSAAEPWLLQQITISDDVSSAKKTFDYGEFVKSGSVVTLDGKTKQDGASKQAQAGGQSYTVTTVTGDKANGGTTGNVYLTIVGKNGELGPRLLNELSTNFKKVCDCMHAWILSWLNV